MSRSEPEKPDLDLIQRVQQARMAHDAEAVPSRGASMYWIEAKPKTDSPPVPTPRTGRWVIATHVDAVDTLWATVKAATEAGKLGYKAKVSTSAVPGQQSTDARAIYVCTYDADDAADVARVEAALHELEIEPLGYVRD